MGEVQVRVLGSGNAFNQGGRLNSAYLVENAEQKILVDCGFTTPLAIEKNGFQPNEIDAVLITHYHGDHFAGLAAMLLALKYTSVQCKPLIIIGAGDVEQKVYELVKVLYPGTEGIFDELDLQFKSIEKKNTLGTTQVHSIPMIHSDESLPHGFILEFPSVKIAFSGDTCWHKGVEELIQYSDFIFLECNFAEKIGKGHISVQELEESALVQTRKDDIYLTHLSEVSYELATSRSYNCIEDSQHFIF